MTEKNILSVWRGAGLFPENMVHFLHQLLNATYTISTFIAPTALSTSASTPFMLASSPPEPPTLKSTNQAFLSALTSVNITHAHKTHVCQLSGITDRLQAKATISQRELDEMPASFKRYPLQGPIHASFEFVVFAENRIGGRGRFGIM